MPSLRPAAVTVIVGTWVVCGLTGAPVAAQEPASKRSSIPSLNLSPDVAYAGSETCAACHREIAAVYRRTPMGRSMSPGDDAGHLAKAVKPVVIRDRRSNRYYTVFVRDKALYQSEHELGENGKELFRTTHKLRYAVGSGINGHTFVVQRGDHLFEAPLSYYSRIGRWGLSPGYEIENPGFNRPIVPECIVCHSGRPQPARLGAGRFRNPPFRELAIGCETCHGPGALHVKERSTTAKKPGEADPTIVNPRRLPARLAEDICMKCHQDADVRVLQPGKDYLDIRPGLPLREVLVLLNLPLESSAHNDRDLLEHHSSMKRSRCYIESGEQLGCLTCHNPHEPPPEDKAAYYRAKCFTCHTDSSCTAPRDPRARQASRNDCIACHMPRRDVKIIAHSSLTQHRILRDPGQPYPGAAGQPASADLVYVNGPQSELASLPAVTLLQAYAAFARKRPEYVSRYLALLEQVRQTDLDHPFVQAGLGRREMLRATQEANNKAAVHLSRAVQLGVNAPGPYLDLAEVLARLGRIEEAVKVLRQAVAAFPYAMEVRKALAIRYRDAGRHAEAEETLRQSAALFPESAELREILKRQRTADPAP